MAGGDSRSDDWCDRQIGPKQVLIIDVTDRCVVLIVKDQRSLHRFAAVRGLEEAGVQVGQQAIAKLDRGADVILNDITERPGVLVDVADLGVVATGRSQCAVLHPPQEEPAFELP